MLKNSRLNVFTKRLIKENVGAGALDGPHKSCQPDLLTQLSCQSDLFAHMIC